MERIKTLTCPECGAAFDVECPEVGSAAAGIWESFAVGLCCDVCAEANKRRAMAADCERYYATRLAAAGIPAAFRDYDPVKGNARILDWIRTNRNSWLYIGGEYGCGKSRAVSHAGGALAKRGEDVLYLPATDLARGASRQWMDDAPDPVALAMGCELLILDDLGKEKITARTAETLFAVIDGRYREGRRIWITSNYSIPAMVARIEDEIGAAIARRLREMCVNYEPDKEVAK